MDGFKQPWSTSVHKHFQKYELYKCPLVAKHNHSTNTIYHSRTLAQHKIAQHWKAASSSVYILTEICFLSKATRERNWVKMEKRGLGLYPRQKLSNCSGLAPSCITFQSVSVTDKLYLMQPKCIKLIIRIRHRWLYRLLEHLVRWQRLSSSI